MIIAVLGNDSKFCLQLKELLLGQGHQVVLVPDFSGGFSRVLESRSHLVVIAGSPNKAAALELIRTLRGHAATRQIPILGFSPQRAEHEVVELLDAGADDYISRPFHAQIFLARVRTLLRRQIWSGSLREEPLASISAGELTLQLIERSALLGGSEIPLTRLEFDLLSFLLRNKEKVLKRSEILESVWKYPEDVETRTLDKHVETLRRKLGSLGPCIRTVHGVGYRFLDPQPPLPSPPAAH